MQISAEYKINYSTAKTLIRNEKLKKGKVKLSELNIENCMMDKDPADTIDIQAPTCTYKSINYRSLDENQ